MAAAVQPGTEEHRITTDTLHPTVVIAHDRGDELASSPGVDARVHSLVAWAREAGADVRVMSIASDRTTRSSRAFAVLRPIGRFDQSLTADVLVVVALNMPHMVLLGIRFARRRNVLIDVCDTAIGTARAALAARLPLQIAKGLLQIALVGIASRVRGTPVSYVTEKDRRHDLALLRRGPAVLVPQAVDDAVTDLEPYVGPPERIVIAADFSAYHNRAGLQLLLACIVDGSIRVTVPIELFGPSAPDFALPRGMTFRGFVPSKTDIYRGQTAVFVPNMAEAGQLNKLLEALKAGRPVLAGRAVAAHLADGRTVTTYDGATDLRREFPSLQTRVLPAGSRWPEAVAAVTPFEAMLAAFEDARSDDR